MITAVFDTKPYDREYLSQAPDTEFISWRFHEFRLSAETRDIAPGCGS
jgi:D-lactate dehydrogenase